MASAHQASDGLPVRAIEQRANLEARLGERHGDEPRVIAANHFGKKELQTVMEPLEEAVRRLRAGERHGRQPVESARPGGDAGAQWTRRWPSDPGGKGPACRANAHRPRRSLLLERCRRCRCPVGVAPARSALEQLAALGALAEVMGGSGADPCPAGALLARRLASIGQTLLDAEQALAPPPEPPRGTEDDRMETLR